MVAKQNGGKRFQGNIREAESMEFDDRLAIEVKGDEEKSLRFLAWLLPSNDIGQRRKSNLGSG